MIRHDDALLAPPHGDDRAELNDGPTAGNADPQPEHGGENVPAGILMPQVSLVGEVSDQTVRDLVDQLKDVGDGDTPIVVEMTTLGGDAEMARRMVLEIDLARQRLAPRRLVFLGKSVVYSAGVTLMSAFPRHDRYLTDDCELLIHCRQLQKTVELDGPIRGSLPEIEALKAQLETGIKLEEENFERLIKGSKVTMDELVEKALYNWYLSSKEACDLDLIAGVVPIRRA